MFHLGVKMNYRSINSNFRYAYSFKIKIHKPHVTQLELNKSYYFTMKGGHVLAGVLIGIDDTDGSYHLLHSKKDNIHTNIWVNPTAVLWISDDIKLASQKLWYD